MSKKSLNKKKRLAKANKQNKRLPLFVVARTHRRLQTNVKQRRWRTNKLRIKDE